MDEKKLKQRVHTLNSLVKTLNIEVKMLRDENERLKIDVDFDPFRPIKTVPKIAEYMQCSVSTVYNYLDDLQRVGAVGYEYSNRNCTKRMVAIPYLIMKYYRERNYQFLREKGKEWQRSPLRKQNLKLKKSKTE